MNEVQENDDELQMTNKQFSIHQQLGCIQAIEAPNQQSPFIRPHKPELKACQSPFLEPSRVVLFDAPTPIEVIKPLEESKNRDKIEDRDQSSDDIRHRMNEEFPVAKVPLAQDH